MTLKHALHLPGFLACLVIAVAEEPLSEARRLNNEAARCYAEGKFEDAEQLYRSALKIGPEDGLTVAKISTNLGVLYQRLDRHAEAESMYKQALELRRKLLPPIRPELAYSMNNLAEVYRLQGRYWEARNLTAAAVQALERSNPEDPEMAVLLSNLGGLEKGLNNLDAAERLLRKAWSVAGKLVGPDTLPVAIILNNLAQVLEAKQDFDNARSLYLHSTSINETLGPAGSRGLAVALANMGRMDGGLGRYEEAAQEELRALAILDVQPKLNVLLRAEVLHNLGKIFGANGNMTDSLLYFDQSLAIEERIRGREHPLIADLLLDYSTAALRAGKKSQARKLRKRGAEMLARRLDHDPARFSIDASALRDTSAASR